MRLNDSWFQWKEIREYPLKIQSLVYPSDWIVLESLKSLNKPYSNPNDVLPFIPKLTEEMIYELIFNGMPLEIEKTQLTKELLWIQHLHSWWNQGFLPNDYGLLEKWFGSEVKMLEEYFETLPFFHRSFIICWAGEDTTYRAYRHKVVEEPDFKWFSPYHALELVEPID